MNERWFTEEELTELSRPTMDRAIEAIDAGDLDGARRRCEEMKHEWLMLHDLMVEGVLGLISFIQDKLGTTGSPRRGRRGRRTAGSATTTPSTGCRARSSLPPGRHLAGTLGLGVGEHPGAFTITEDDEKVTFTMTRAGRGSAWCARDLRAPRRGPHARGARLVVRAQGLPPLLHPLHVHERVAADPVERLPALPVRSAGRLRHRSVHLVLVQGPGRDPERHWARYGASRPSRGADGQRRGAARVHAPDAAPAQAQLAPAPDAGGGAGQHDDAVVARSRPA